MREFSKTEIKKIRQAIESKKQSFPPDWLGRALAYTPYQPRTLFFTSSPTFAENIQPKKEDNKDSTIATFYRFPNLSQEKLALDSILQYAKDYQAKANGFFIESLETLTFIRRYVSIPLIYDFLILDSYQLLESLVYGADAVILTPKFLTQKGLKDLSDYAFKIGLERIFRIDSKEDLTKSIFARADILDLNTNFSLIPMIPKNKIILSIIPQEINDQKSYIKALDAQILAVES